MAKKAEQLVLVDYESADAEEDLGATDPGVMLRKALSQVPGPQDTSALNELLYTASERGISEYLACDADAALLIWRLVELSRTLTPAQVEEFRM